MEVGYLSGSGFHSTADDLLLVDFFFVCCNKGVDVSAHLVCFFFLIYYGVFDSIIIEVMSSACVSYLFIIGYCGMSASIMWRLISINWASPSTVWYCLMSINGQARGLCAERVFSLLSLGTCIHTCVILIFIDKSSL